MTGGEDMKKPIKKYSLCIFLALTLCGCGHMSNTEKKEVGSDLLKQGHEVNEQLKEDAKEVNDRVLGK